jgi:AcrR family transcriptional regulator
MTEVGFVDLLKAQAVAIGDRRNAPHTRLRIQIATAELLQTSGYDKLSINAICKAVDLTRPGFYLHYRNKEEVVLDLLRALVKAEAQLSPSLTDCDDLYQAVEKICDWYLRFHIGSGALFATLTEMRRSSLEVYELWNERSRYLLESITYQFNRFKRYRDLDQGWATFALEATARAMNVTADRINSHPGPITKLYTDDVGHLVKMFARMMYQSMLGEPMPSVQQEEDEADLCT